MFDMQEGRASGAGRLTGRWAAMQVISSKDAAIEDLKKRLAATQEEAGRFLGQLPEKQLAMETENFKKIQVSGEGVEGENVCTVTDPNISERIYVLHTCIHIRRTWRRPRRTWWRTKR